MIHGSIGTLPNTWKRVAIRVDETEGRSDQIQLPIFQPIDFQPKPFAGTYVIRVHERDKFRVRGPYCAIARWRSALMTRLNDGDVRTMPVQDLERPVR